MANTLDNNRDRLRNDEQSKTTDEQQGRRPTAQQGSRDRDEDEKMSQGRKEKSAIGGKDDFGGKSGIDRESSSDKQARGMGEDEKGGAETTATDRDR